MKALGLVLVALFVMIGIGPMTPLTPEGLRLALRGGPSDLLAWTRDAIDTHASGGGASERSPGVDGALVAGGEGTALEPPASMPGGAAAGPLSSGDAVILSANPGYGPAPASSSPAGAPPSAPVLASPVPAQSASEGAGDSTDPAAESLSDPALHDPSEANSAPSPTITAAAAPSPSPSVTATPSASTPGATPSATPGVVASPVVTPQPTSTPAPSIAGGGSFDGSAAAALLAEINRERGAAGLGPLSSNGALAGVAASHASDIATQRRLSHTSSNGRDFAARMRAGGAKFGAAAENVAAGRGGASGMPSVAQAFMNSPVHRANILNASFAEVGIAVVHGSDGVDWVTVVFTD